jgi:cytochrome d ubiquinol oxidase subunit II
MMYVIMDGFDLGIGILFPFVHDRHDRDTMVNNRRSCMGRQRNLVGSGRGCITGGVPPRLLRHLERALSAAGPDARLIWRGVAFEFRFKADEAHKPIWDKAFASGSYIATFSQGVALGTFITGFEVKDGAYAGGGLDWLTPFSLFTGFGLLAAYALLGSTWLVMKTEGALQHRMKALARPVTITVLATIAIVSLWTPLSHPAVAFIP